MIDFETFDVEPDPQVSLPFPPNTQASLATSLWAVGIVRMGFINWAAPVYGEWTHDPTLAGLFDLERAEFIAQLAWARVNSLPSARVIMPPESCLHVFTPSEPYVYQRARTHGEQVLRVAPALTLGFEVFA